MDCRARLESLFRERGVSFEVQEHPTAFTSQTVAASEHVPGRMFAKVVMALADGRLVMLVLPAPSMVGVSKLGAVFDKQIRLAYEEDFACAFRLRAKGDAALRERGARVRRPNVGEH
jgi:Ala-tRNA(Pro) deacylase